MFTLHSIYDPMCVTLTCDAVCRNVIYVYSTQIMIVKVTPLSKHFTNSCTKLTQSQGQKHILKCCLHKIECNLQFINLSN